jgi:DNA polymerase/3'-5' exonuclease PolX
MNTDNIIKTLKEYNKFDYFIKNLKDYKKKIISEKEIENIDGYNSEIKNIIFAFDDNFKKQLIIAHLELIRDYYVYTNEVIKVKVYNTAIANIKKETDISNLRKIKGVGVGLEKMINELFSKGKIAFIENVIKKDIEFMITRKGNRTKKEDIKNDFNKKTIIQNLEKIRNYELYKDNIDKAKIYSLAIYNLYKYPKELKELKDLKEIKGIGPAITFFLNELKYNGKISYIENVINKDKNFKNKLKDYKINKEIIIKNLDLIKDYETYNNEIYKVRAYTNAINNIIINSRDMTSLDHAYHLENIGDKIMEKIFELYFTGKIEYVENKIKTDNEYHFKLELLEIHGIGPKNAKKIIDAGIKTIAELKKNTNLLNNKQKIGLKYYDDLNKKIPLDEYNKHLTILKKDLKDIIYDFTGSYRRGSKMMGDIDILIMETPKFKLNDYITKLHNSKYIIEILALGNNKFMGIVQLPGKPARRIDILVAPKNEYYYSLLYFTGSYIFNIGMRHYAKTKFDLSLSEHGFLGKKIEANSEEDIFNHLKLKYIKPIERNKFYL